MGGFLVVTFVDWMEQVQAMTLPLAMDLFGYRGGDMIDGNDLKRRYRSLSLRHHPDRGGETDDFVNVNAAYGFLGRYVGGVLPGGVSQGYGYSGSASGGADYRGTWSEVEDLLEGIAMIFERVDRMLAARGKKDYDAIRGMLDEIARRKSDGSFEESGKLSRLNLALEKLLEPGVYDRIRGVLRDLGHSLGTLRSYVDTFGIASLRQVKGMFAHLADQIRSLRSS